MQAASFFRWKPTAVVLWLFGVGFALVAILNVWLSVLAARGSIHDASIGDSQRLVRVVLRGAVVNGIIAVLCLASWYSMRRRTQASLMTGATAVSIALFITSARWMFWQIKGTNPLSWVEPVFVWPFLVYAIVYAYRESRIQNKLGTIQPHSNHHSPPAN